MSAQREKERGAGGKGRRAGGGEVFKNPVCTVRFVSRFQISQREISQEWKIKARIIQECTCVCMCVCVYARALKFRMHFAFSAKREEEDSFNARYTPALTPPKEETDR